MQCFVHWERCSHTFSSQSMFISVGLFYTETPYECDNAFPKLKCILTPFLHRKKNCLPECVVTGLQHLGLYKMMQWAFPSGMLSIFHLICLSSSCLTTNYCETEVSILGGWGVATPQILGRGSWGVSRGSWTGRKILLYIIMYRKCFRKWWLLKRNRITCPETAVNCQFLPEKSNFFVKLPKKSKFFRNFPWKIEIFSEITWRNWNLKIDFLWNCLKKSKFFGNLSWKIKFFCEITWKKSKFFGNLPEKSIFCEIA